MDGFERTVKTKLWIFEGPSPWYMVTIPLSVSTEIKKKFGMHHRGWGSIPVEVRIGSSIWKTSIFWEKKGTYILPIKKEIRRAEKITSGDLITVSLLIENVIYRERLIVLLNTCIMTDHEIKRESQFAPA